MKFRILAVMSVVLSITTITGCESDGQPEAETTLIGVWVPMRDDVRLLTDVYLPEGEAPFPVIISRVPYGTQTDYIFQSKYGEFFTSNGFAYVAQNVRGRYGSEGVFTGFVDDKEIDDAYDTIDWIIEQPWSDGNVGVMGESYYGYTSLMAAVSGHPAIKAISPANITLAREKQTLDGSFPIQSGSLWTLEMDDPGGEYQDIDQLDLYHLPLITLGEAHGLKDDLWRDRVSGYSEKPLEEAVIAVEQYKQVRVPALHFGGWYDTYTRGSIAIWDGVRQTSLSEDARSNQWLVIGPWDHENTSLHISGAAPSTNIGRLDYGPNARTTYGEIIIEFFDYFLKGEANGFGQRPKVHYFNIGDNDWRDADTWPPTATETHSLYLHGNGTLRADTPSDEGMTTYQYDPRDPVTITEKTDVWVRASGKVDRQELLDRDDVLVFETEPLEENTDVTGPIKVELFASTSVADTDFTAALVDVAPDGYSLLIQEGIIRAAYRNRDGNLSLVTPGEVYRFDIDLWATSYTVPAGHRLRLEISSSNFPRYARNLNNGEPFGVSDLIEVATQTIHHSADYPSRLLLPLMP
jgi:putative CocE/NonD family hydrolase